MSWKRTVYFYQLSLYREEVIQPNDAQTTVKKTYFKNDEIFNIFSRIYPSKFVSNGCFNAIALELGVNQITFEVIDIDKKLVFARIGRINDSNTIQLRNIDTLEPDEIDRDTNQGIETYTYLIIDFSTGIISYVSVQGAPGITKLWALFENNVPGVRAEVIPIIESDVIDIIRRKRKVTNVKFTVSLPSDSMLGMDGLGVDRQVFEAISNLKHQTISVVLQAERDQSLFQNTNSVINIINGIMRKFNREKIKEITVSAKDPNENIQPYHILKHQFTKKVPLRKDDEHGGLNMLEVKQKLIENYERIKEDLLRNCR